MGFCVSGVLPFGEITIVVVVVSVLTFVYPFSATEPLLPATSDVSVHHTLSASKLMNLGSRGFPFSRTGGPGTRIVSTKTVPTMYQSSKSQKQSKKSKDSQNSKNDNWCTNRHNGHMSTKTVPTVYQECNNRQKQSKDSQNSKNEGLRVRG